MKALRVLFPAALVAAVAATAVASEPVSDFPGASDLRTLTRPANSYIIGAMHVDNDEYAVPLGPVESHSTTLGKNLLVTGPIDTLAYAGPKTASTLTTYNELASQLTGSGYTLVWSCARATCGSGFTLANILDKPMIDSIHTGNWGFWLNDDLNATNDDIRYGTFRKGAEYMLVMASLQPGQDSGALVIRVNGPNSDPVLRLADGVPTGANSANGAAATTTTNGTAATTNSTSQQTTGNVRSRVRGLLNQIQH